MGLRPEHVIRATARRQFEREVDRDRARQADSRGVVEQYAEPRYELVTGRRRGGS